MGLQEEVTIERNLELGAITEELGYICHGCLLRGMHEHRCHGSDGKWKDGHSCQCPECRELEELFPMS